MFDLPNMVCYSVYPLRNQRVEKGGFSDDDKKYVPGFSHSGVTAVSLILLYGHYMYYKL
jgi:hypothetical protein